MQLTAKDYPHLTNEVLFNRYVGGDLSAFDELLNRHKGLLYTLILKYVPNRSEADEIFQDVFFKVCKNKELFKESVSFKSWLVTICKNTCIDHTRKRKNRLLNDSFDNLPGDEHRAPSESIASKDLGPDQTLTIQTEGQELEALLDKLPTEQRETFYLKVIMEFTFEEIGESMGCSCNTAKSRFRYALDSLRGLVRRKKVFEKAV